MITRSKQQLYGRQADIIKAFGHPLRLAILDFLSDGRQCVCDIADHVGSERSNVSRHLSVMLSAGILEQHKEGLKVLYKLKTPCILKCLSCITAVLKEQIKESKKLMAAID